MISRDLASADWGGTWSVWKDDLVFDQGAVSMPALPGTDTDLGLPIGLMRDDIWRRQNTASEQHD